MTAIPIGSDGHARRGGMSAAKGLVILLIVLLAFAAAALGTYWLATEPAATGSESTASAVDPARPERDSRPAAPAASESLLKAPSASCVDGRPASDEVSVDACL